MVFQSIFLSILISLFNTVAVNTVENITSWISPTYAESNEEIAVEAEEEESTLGFGHILINNERVDLDEDGRIFVTRDDAIRVAGNSSPNAVITVYFADKEKSTIATEDGFWFVLFSITNLEENEYVLTARETDTDMDSVELFSFVVGEGHEVVEPSLDASFTSVTDFVESLPVFLLLLILLPLALAIGWILGATLMKKNDGKK